MLDFRHWTLLLTPEKTKLVTNIFQHPSSNIQYPMFSFTTAPFRVRYADTDQMGYVYYGNYARFYEIGRVEALRSLGFLYREMEASGVQMPVYEHTSKYHKPARYDDLLTVAVTIAELPRARIVFRYAIYNEAGELLNSGQTTLVFQRIDTGRLCGVPLPLLERLKPFFTHAVGTV